MCKISLRLVFLLFIVSIAMIGGCKDKSTEPGLDIVATPVFDPPGGTYTSPHTVSISCATPGATIHYTTDGTDPHPGSSVYGAPLHFLQDTTIKALAVRIGWKESKIATVNYALNIAPIEMVLVSGGTFNNGTSDVTVSSFYMDKYELTQAQYEAMMGANPSYYSGNPNSPVEKVSWYNAIEYSNRRSMAEGLTPCYSYSSYGTNPDSWPSGWNTDFNNHSNVACNWTANGYRLPTEAEWEFAARGGNQSHNYTYSGSNTIGNVAWYYDNSYAMGSSHPDYGTHTVGSKTANELGLYDMSGNVWEWTWDIYGEYPSNSQTNPTGANSGSDRVSRGGSWLNSANGCTVSYRLYSNATHSYDSIGFRCVRVSP